MLGVVTGLEFEADLVRRYARRGDVADRVWVACGLGRDQANAAAERLIADGARALLSFGIAGGVSPAVSRGTLVLSTEIRGEALHPLPTSSEWNARLITLLDPLGATTHSPLAHTPHVVATTVEKARLCAATGAVAVDMESYGIAEAAFQARLPFTAIRVVADTAAESLPEIALHAVAPDGSVRLAETIGRVARSPQQIPALIRLGRATSRARARLNEIAALCTRRLFLSQP